MKKIGLLFITSLIGVCSLTGCEIVDNIINGKDVLPYSMSEAQNNLKTLGKEQGFEITFTGSGSSEGESGSGDVTVGLKDDIFWVKEEAAYKNVEGGLEYYEYSDSSYQFKEIEDKFTFDSIIEQSTKAFYAGYTIIGLGFANEQKVTFLGRSAIQYDATLSASDASASFLLVIDEQTGITLKFLATATDGTNEASEGQIEVTSFRIGDEVTAPTLVKAENA